MAAEAGGGGAAAVGAAPKIEIYDTTLRDGSQQVGLDLTVADKLRVALALDGLGVDVIEGGWPGSNPKDAEFFERAKQLELQNSVLAAFGATRLPGRNVEDDASLAALIAAETPIVTLVGKSWTLHVDEALRTTRAENLAMVADSIAYMAAAGRRVVFDAEHFFDGYHADRGYALEVLSAAAEAGSDTLVLCDTNGGTLPDDVSRIVAEVSDLFGQRPGTSVGVHFHNDAACAVANSVVAVGAGSLHVQGAANGYGERCGNADLFSVIASLELKRGHSLLPEGRLGALASTARAIAELANLPFEARQPYVGSSAFATKAGLHASAIARRPDAYSHVSPAAVGNKAQVLVSELAGRSNVLAKAAELGLDLSADPGLAGRVLEQVKEAEHRGYAFEAADASFELLVRRSAGVLPSWFELEGYRVVVERDSSDDRSEAIVRLLLGAGRMVAVGEGVGPVHALDQALRRALSEVYPELQGIHLVDFKVRILDGRAATSAVTRVILTSADADGEWTTVGVSSDIVTASWEALTDGVAYGLLRAGAEPVAEKISEAV
ncbi:MAG: citramalate synthase [Actinobacteria bacterium]|nr:citramalate synthase [Actinomycetota bacterium]